MKKLFSDIKKQRGIFSFLNSKKRFGFTLVEVMVSMTIMTVVALGAATTLVGNKVSSLRVDDSLLAMMILEKKSAELRRDFYTNGSPIPSSQNLNVPWLDNRLPTAQNQVWEMPPPEYSASEIKVFWSLVPDPKRPGSFVDRMIRVDLNLTWKDKQNYERSRSVTNYFVKP